MGDVTGLGGAVVLAIALMTLGRSRYGSLRVSELAGFIWVLLAGHPYRAQARDILSSRERWQQL